MHLLDISNKRILFGVLNWGMGHASRSSKLIQQLLEQNNKIQIASAGQALAYLKTKFPELPVHDLKTGEIIYPAHKQLWFNLLLQSKKIQHSIREEENFVAKALENDQHIDLIISDNCYGFHSKKIHSIFITHQLHVKAPFLEKKIQQKIHSFITPFNEIWIPDVEGDLNLSGQLSHPAVPAIKCTYIGPISLANASDPSLANETKFDYCAIISGPEKQRTVFENQVMSFLKKQYRPTVLIRGLASNTVSKIESTKLITVYDFKQGDELIQLINQSKMVIARSGYSTIMDMYHLKKSCILIPTPGQTEQAYLFKKHFGNTSRKIEQVKPKTIGLCAG